MLSVLWEGPMFSPGSLAHVNRELCHILNRQPDIALSISPLDREDTSENWFPYHKELQNLYRRTLPNVKYHIRQQWPPSFLPPGTGKWILFQPWEYGYIPKEWVAPISFDIDEVWVNSQFTRQMYINSGIPPAKVFSFPLGFSPDVFSPTGDKLLGIPDSTFKFLFVGGTIARKGIDTLLNAYIQAFGPSDDVCLVIKDFGTGSAYKGQTYQEFIKQLQSNPMLPKIIYIEDSLSPQQMAALYRECHCLVHPYRGEGFGLPILEAMACGLPVIVPNNGPATEFANTNCALFVPSTLSRGVNTLNLVNDPILIETDPNVLGQIMRLAVEKRKVLLYMGQNASDHAYANYTWEKAGALLVNHLHDRSFMEKPVARQQRKNWIKLRKQFKTKGNWESVYFCATHSLAENPKDSESLVALYESFIHLGKEGEVISQLHKMMKETSIVRMSKADIHYLLALAMYQLKRYIDAKQHCEIGLSQNPMERLKSLYALVLQDIESTKQQFEKLLPSFRETMLPSVTHTEEVGYNVIKSVRPKWFGLFRPGEQIVFITTCHTSLAVDQFDTGVSVDYHLVDHQRLTSFCTCQDDTFLPTELFSKTCNGIVVDHIVESLPVDVAQKFLKRCHSLLARNGRLVVTFSEINGSQEPVSSWKSIEAMQQYTKDNVRQWLEEIGLGVTEVSGPTVANDESYVVAKETALPLYWQSPVLNTSGYATENQIMLQGLRAYPFSIQLNLRESDSKPDLYEDSFLKYVHACINNPLKKPIVDIQNTPASGFLRPSAPISIGRTMFETDRIPEEWVWRCNQLSEIWVPSSFNAETFARSGVDPAKIKVIAEPFDFNYYSPSKTVVQSDLAPNLKDFVFFSNFAWNYRKGWDVLIRAFIEEFTAEDEVCLLIKTSRMTKADTPKMEIYRYIQSLGRSPEDCPSIRVIDSFLDESQVKSLYAASHAFVLPTRGEGWGRPFVEAMAMELPVIGTNWGGSTEFMNQQNSFLIDIDGLERVDERMHLDFYHGHYWASPNVASTRRGLREVYENYDIVKARAVRSRKDLINKLSPQKIAQTITERISHLIDEYRKL